MPWSTLQNWSGRLRVKIRRQQVSASAGWPALRWTFLSFDRFVEETLRGLTPPLCARFRPVESPPYSPGRCSISVGCCIW